MPKVILTKMLSLEMFGYYSLANILVMNMNRFSGPVVKAIYPRLASLFILGADEEIVKLYHKSSQLVSVLILPASVVVAFFSKEILLLWTRDIVTADQTWFLVSVLLIGSTFNSLMFIPYALQLASGWTRLGFFTNLVSVFILAPLFFVLIKQFGAIGAATTWGILSIGYFLFTIPIMHLRLIPDEKWRWYFQDIGLPLLVALFVVGAFRLAVPVPVQDAWLIIYLFIISAVTLGATAIATPATRIWLLQKMVN